MHVGEFVALSELFAQGATGSRGVTQGGAREEARDHSVGSTGPASGSTPMSAHDGSTSLPITRDAFDANAVDDGRDALDVDRGSTSGERCACESSRTRISALREARLFRARLGDAFDDAAFRLLRDLAADVLARELLLAPCDLAAIAHRVALAAPVVCVRVAPGDDRPIGDIAVVRDDSLMQGDAIVEVVGGSVDARLGVRLADVLEAWR